MMQTSVIIHTRTRLCDFPSTLAVCPSTIGNSDVVKNIRRKILSATRAIDNMGQNDERRMIYTCGDLIIAGMVSFLKNLSDNNADNERFFYDEKGRRIYAFVGFVFQAGNQSVPLIDRKILWDSFKAYMEPVWERTVLDTQLSDFKEIDFPPAVFKEPSNGKSIDDMTLYTMGAEDASIFSYWLSQALKGKPVSFCSNISDFKVVKDKSFNIITTTANIVERMKGEKKSIPLLNEPSQTTDYPHEDDSKDNTVKKKPSTDGENPQKRLPVIWLMIFVILFMIFLVILLLK